MTSVTPTSLTYHGVFLEIFDKGVLLTGPSGCGKSECALKLIEKGHRLIADDAPTFTLANDEIIGTNPGHFAHGLEVRGLGIIDVSQIYGSHCVLTRKPLDLIILFSETSERVLMPSLDEQFILGIPIKQLTISLAFSKDLAMLVEIAVKLEKLEYRTLCDLSL